MQKALTKRINVFHAVLSNYDTRMQLYIFVPSFFVFFFFLKKKNFNYSMNLYIRFLFYFILFF
jgi:hypothetical protein